MEKEKRRRRCFTLFTVQSISVSMVLQLPLDHAHMVVQLTVPTCQGPGTGNVVKAERLVPSPYPEFQKRNLSQE